VAAPFVFAAAIDGRDLADSGPRASDAVRGGVPIADRCHGGRAVGVLPSFVALWRYDWADAAVWYAAWVARFNGSDVGGAVVSG
jgi:hypothetical protein